MSDAAPVRMRIEPRTLRGFRDYLPAQMLAREQLMETARRVYRSFGFAPIDTPALEYLEVLTGKGSDETDKQLYKFEDQGGRWVGMRFDLTVPLARFAAEHASELGTPFKRYHIAPVWRGENTQRGRYREFVQCDFDTLGTRSLNADIETALVIHELLLAIGFDDFTIRLNNRLVLNGLLEKLGLAGQATAALRALDKLAKVGPEKVTAELAQTAGASSEQSAAILRLANLGGGNDEILRELAPLVAGNELGERGVDQLAQVVAAVRAAGVPEARVQLDVSIARGLDYYTGTIYETLLGQLPGIGSVCSGGRYDNLVEVFSTQSLPGVGASLGLDRLLAAMEELQLLPQAATPAPVLLINFVEARQHEYLQLAARLRAAGLGVEFYPETKRVGQQLKYADRKGFRVALIIGDDEWAQGLCQIKNLKTGDSQTIALAEPTLVAAIQAVLGEQP